MKTDFDRAAAMPAAITALCLAMSPLTAQPADSRQSGSPPSPGSAQISESAAPAVSLMSDAPSALRRSASAQRVRELTGQPVRTAGGEQVGEIGDVAIEPRSGELASLLVRSGGVLGIGGQVREVPLASLQLSADWNAATLRLERSAFENLPPGSGPGSAAASAPGSRSGRPVLASSLEGREIRNVNQVIGIVEDVLINPDRETASLLVDLDDSLGVAGTSYVIGFNQVNINTLTSDPVLTTRLSGSDFEGTANLSSTAALSAGRPYAWRGDASVVDRSTGSATYSAGGDGRSSDMASTTATAATAGGRTPGGDTVAAGDPAGTLDETVRFAGSTPDPQSRSAAAGETVAGTGPEAWADSAHEVREALRRDSSLGRAGRSVDVVMSGQTIVLSGTVPNHAVRERIVESARSAAAGHEVEDRLTIGATAE